MATRMLKELTVYHLYQTGDVYFKCSCMMLLSESSKHNEHLYACMCVCYLIQILIL